RDLVDIGRDQVQEGGCARLGAGELNRRVRAERVSAGRIDSKIKIDTVRGNSHHFAASPRLIARQIRSRHSLTLTARPASGVPGRPTGSIRSREQPETGWP